MKKTLLLMAACVFASAAASAQERYTPEDVLGVFAQYNPAALEKAKTNPEYNALLQEVAKAYQEAKTPVANIELIALVKNFDNSIRLQALKEEFQNGLRLQKVTPIDLNALEQNTLSQLEELFTDIHSTTIDLRKMEIDWYKNQIKTVKQNKELSKEEIKGSVANFKSGIKNTKQEMKTLKKDAKAQIKDTALLYMADFKTELAEQAKHAAASAAEHKAEQAKAAKNLQVKNKNKKPVAK